MKSDPSRWNQAFSSQEARCFDSPVELETAGLAVAAAERYAEKGERVPDEWYL